MGMTLEHENHRIVVTAPALLSHIAREARANSERWFPFVHDTDQAIVPLAAHYALGMCGEAGEVANVVKKGLRRGDVGSAEELAPELADVFIYLVLLADEVGVDLFEAYKAKAAVCEERWGTPAPAVESDPTEPLRRPVPVDDIG